MTLDYSKLPEVWQWVLLIGAILTALGIIWVFVRKAWRAGKRVMGTINILTELPTALAEEHQFRVEATATLKKLARVQGTHTTQIRAIRHEVQFNNGSSVKDAISRVEQGVAGLYTRVDANEKSASEDRADIAATRQELEQTRPPKPRRIVPQK